MLRYDYKTLLLFDMVARFDLSIMELYVFSCLVLAGRAEQH